MNNKKLIRLTEADLHRIVKESVNKVLNEVEYNGGSYHGYYGPSDEDKRKAAIDWMCMRQKRIDKSKELDDASDKAFGDGDEKWYEPGKQALRNRINGYQDFSNAYEMLRGDKFDTDNASHFDERGRRKW